MEGIIVHAEHVYRATSIPVLVVGVLVISAVMAWLILLVVRDFKKKGKDRWWHCLLVSIYAVGAVLLTIGMVKETNTIHKDLIVTIEDTVGFNEFNDRYEIVSQDGSLYIVRELPIEETEAGDE